MHAITEEIAFKHAKLSLHAKRDMHWICSWDALSFLKKIATQSEFSLRAISSKVQSFQKVLLQCFQEM